MSDRLDPVKTSFHTKALDVFRSAMLVDRQKGVVRRRNIEAVAVFVVFLYFGSQVMMGQGQQTPSLLMCVLCLVVLLLMWQYPTYVNRTFAYSKEKNAPEVELEVTEAGMAVSEGGSDYEIPFAGGCVIYDYRNLMAVCHGKNRVLTIPRDQLDEETLENMIALFKAGLGDNYHFIPVKEKCRQRIPWLD